MNRDHRPDRTALIDWENWLEPQVRNVELLGEIPLASEECQQLGRMLGQDLFSLGLAWASHVIEDQCPCSFAVFLVAQGIYGYDGLGGYWPGVSDITGTYLGSNWTSELGRLFEQVLGNLGLPLFPDLGGRRYVDLILMHGGIPDYCLSDFFVNMLQPGVTQLYYEGMSAEELVEEWLWHTSARYSTDKPVLRFLEFGGQVAEDFVERCREMALEHLDSGSVPAAEEVGLPTRIVNAYRHWIARQSRDQVRRRSSERWHLRKPQILLDPWGEGIILDLPSQSLPAGTSVYTKVVWKIETGDNIELIPVRVRRTGSERKTVSVSVPLSQPAEMYQVSLHANYETKRSWRYQGISQKRPLLAFDAERSTLLPGNPFLPARCLRLLYPGQDTSLHIEDATLVEDLPQMPWGWSDFCGQEWDLRNATRLSLTSPGHTLTLDIRPDEAAQRPQLVGGQLVLGKSVHNELPIYVGVPPCIRIPRSSRRSIPDELARWRIRVIHRGPAVPSVQTTISLTDLRSQIVIDERHIDLPLGISTLLGESPMGCFLIHLRGPLGRDADLVFRIVPHLIIQGHDTLYLADPRNGAQAATLSVEIGPKENLEHTLNGYESAKHEVQLDELRDDQVRCSGNRQFKVVVGPDTPGVELGVTRALPSGIKIRVPFLVPIRRMRWALVDTEAASQARNWEANTITYPLDGVLQMQSPFLLVEIPPTDQERIKLDLGLLNADHTELQTTATVVCLSGGQRLGRFALSEFLDTARASASSVLHVELHASGLAGQRDDLCWIVLDLTQAFVVQDVSVESTFKADILAVTVCWQESVHLNNRHLFFWSIRQADLPVCVQSIPDETSDEFHFEVPVSELPPGEYMLAFSIVDPWSPTMPLKPAKDDDDVTLVKVGLQPAQLVQMLQRASNADNPTARKRALSLALDIFLVSEVAVLDDTSQSEQEILSQVEAWTKKWGAKLKSVPQNTRSAFDRLFAKRPVELMQAIAKVSYNRQAHSKLRHLLLTSGLLDDSIVPIIVSTALDESHMEALWQLWPPLGLAIERSKVSKGSPGARKRMVQHLGIESVSQALDGRKLNDLSIRAEMETMLGYSRTQLQRMKEVMLPVDGLLTPTKWGEITLEWVINVHSGKKLQAWDWLHSNLTTVITDLEQLGAARLLDHSLANALENRYFDDAEYALFNVPFLVGSIALIQRLLAHSEKARRLVCLQGPGLHRLALVALEIAPLLYARDLCLFELVLIEKHQVS